MLRKLPIGINDFEELRNNGYIYVDKTEYIYNLIQNGKVYFMSRPYHFGKSLLLSTIKAYFEGKHSLFNGLKIDTLSRNNSNNGNNSNKTTKNNNTNNSNSTNDGWSSYPVFYFDFNNSRNCNSSKSSNSSSEDMEEALRVHLSSWEAIYGDEFKDRMLGERFRQLLRLAYEQTGKRAVVLVDKHNKSLYELENREYDRHNDTVFRTFFSSLKFSDRFLEFVFIAGVTKFEAGIFSDLNHLHDISQSIDYDEVCGITEREMREYFLPEIESMAVKQELSTEECIVRLKQTYGGYRFDRGGAEVCNPFSLLSALVEKNFDTYGLNTEITAFFADKIAGRENREAGKDGKNEGIEKLADITLYADDLLLSNYEIDTPDIVPILFHTGYLTIVDYNKKFRCYTLGFPNEEVKTNLLKNLLKH